MLLKGKFPNRLGKAMEILNSFCNSTFQVISGINKGFDNIVFYAATEKKNCELRYILKSILPKY